MESTGGGPQTVADREAVEGRSPSPVSGESWELCAAALTGAVDPGWVVRAVRRDVVLQHRLSTLVAVVVAERTDGVKEDDRWAVALVEERPAGDQPLAGHRHLSPQDFGIPADSVASASAQVLGQIVTGAGVSDLVRQLAFLARWRAMPLPLRAVYATRFLPAFACHALLSLEGDQGEAARFLRALGGFDAKEGGPIKPGFGFERFMTFTAVERTSLYYDDELAEEERRLHKERWGSGILTPQPGEEPATRRPWLQRSQMLRSAKTNADGLVAWPLMLEACREENQHHP